MPWRKRWTTAVYRVSVDARQIETGAWVPNIAIQRAGVAVEFAAPETTQPEWLTEAEAIRSGIERAHLFIDRGDLPT